MKEDPEVDDSDGPSWLDEPADDAADDPADDLAQGSRASMSANLDSRIVVAALADVKPAAVDDSAAKTGPSARTTVTSGVMALTDDDFDVVAADFS